MKAIEEREAQRLTMARAALRNAGACAVFAVVCHALAVLIERGG